MPEAIQTGAVYVCIRRGIVEHVLVAGVAPFDETILDADTLDFESYKDWEKEVEAAHKHCDELDALTAQREQSALQILEELVNADILICGCDSEQCQGDCDHAKAVALIGKRKGE